MSFCKNCGNRLDPNAAVCPVCGAPQQAQAQPQQPMYQQPAPQQTYQQPAYQQHAYQQPAYQQPMAAPGFPKLSDWDGSVLDTFVNSLIASLITSISCGIALPWAVCYIMKFIISHAVIDGRRLRFDGTGGDLFAQYIKWWLLCIITCGIYGFWVAPRLYKWVASNIHYE